MKRTTFFFLFLILMSQAEALMVSPAKIHEERTITITNNINEEASYTVLSECADVDKQKFTLEPAEREEVLVKPKCKGYLEVSEETETAINKFRIPVEERRTVIKEKSSLLIPLIAFCVVAVVLIIVGRKVIKGGGAATASIK